MQPTRHAVQLLTLIAGIICASISPQIAGGEDRHTAEISYLLSPARPLPEHVRNVAVIDAGVASDETDRRNAREQKWSTIAADILEAMLQSEGPAEGQLTVVDRRATREILAEKDMQLVGIVEGDAAAAAGQLLAVQGLVMSRIKIHIDTRRNTKEEIDWTGILGGLVPRGQPRGVVRRPVPPPRDVRRDPRSAPARPRTYRKDARERGRPVTGGDRPVARQRRVNPYRQPYRGGPGVPSLPKKQVEEISRSLTVQCSFTLVDASNGQAILKHATPVIQKQDTAKPKFLFGSTVSEADLDPVDHFIGELVEQAAREFVGLLAPVPVSVHYDLEAAGEGAAGVRLLRADDFDGAIAVFEQAAKSATRRPDTYVFMMGVAHELAGRPQQALESYRRAVAMPDLGKDQLRLYMSAKDRLADWLPRIVVDESGRPVRPANVASSPPAWNSEPRGDNERNSDRKRERKRDDDDDD